MTTPPTLSHPTAWQLVVVEHVIAPIEATPAGTFSGDHVSPAVVVPISSGTPEMVEPVTWQVAAAVHERPESVSKDCPVVCQSPPRALRGLPVPVPHPPVARRDSPAGQRNELLTAQNFGLEKLGGVAGVAV